VEATANLDAINHIGGPWSLTFSYGRALQASALKSWAGKPQNVKIAQAAFTHRAQMNALAQEGHWTEKHEKLVA
jgi:fructose-bisphosphate aldolase, class I